MTKLLTNYILSPFWSKFVFIMMFYLILTQLYYFDSSTFSVECMYSYDEAIEKIAQLEKEKLQLLEDNKHLSESYQVVKTALDVERTEMEKILNEISEAAYKEELLRETIHKHLEKCLQHKTKLEQQLVEKNVILNKSAK